MTSSPAPAHLPPVAARHSRIAGTGSHLPPRRVTNDDLARRLAERGLETSDAWIVERTGIRARHFADDGVTCSDLARPDAGALDDPGVGGFQAANRELARQIVVGDAARRQVAAGASDARIARCGGQRGNRSG